MPVLLFFLVFCRNPAPELQEPREFLFRGETMGTTYSVKIVAVDLPEKEILEDMGHIVDRIDQLMSNWKPASDVSRFGAMSSEEHIQIAPDTKAVLEIALAVATKSQGAFDPTVSPLIELWGFGTKERGEFPSRETVEAIRQHTGYTKLALEGHRLGKTDDGLTLNLGAVAKGYALDAIAAYLEGKGLNHYLIEIGRELRAKGVNIRNQTWRVAIENPDDSAPSPMLRIVNLANRSIATSGDYRQYFEYEGQEYSHIIDPRTGWPIAPRVTLASVIAPECALADAWSTACMVLAPEESLAIINEHPDLECLLVVRQGEGDFKILTSRGMDAYFLQTEEP